MNFNSHSAIEGMHAFLGASNYSWLNYDEEKLCEVWTKNQAKYKGTRLHEIAKSLIEEGIKLPDSNKTLNRYVNDAIGFKMTPEQPLFYSINCFGTADAISFRDNLLRIHDLKTGIIPASMKQLEIYTSLFCLEYDVNPNEIEIENRIYQLDDVFIQEPSKEDILYIMSKIKEFDIVIDNLKEEEM